MAWNSFFIPVGMVGPVLTRWARFWPKWRFLPEMTWKLIFYPGRHGLTRIDPVGSVLTKMTVFTRNDLKTHFLPWSTWFDLYWPGGIGFYGKMRLTREKYILNFKLFFFLIVFWIFMNNNRNKITFKKILVNQKLGYNSCLLFIMLTVQRDWKIHFLLTLHSKFCKEKRWRCWKIHRFFSWSNSYGRPTQVKNMKVFSILILWNTWKWFQQWFCEIHESNFNDFFFLLPRW